eukprot:8320381-Ditylum_brightwellii.AAC.1
MMVQKGPPLMSTRLNTTASNDAKNRNDLGKDKLVESRNESEDKTYTSRDNPDESSLQEKDSNEEEDDNDDNSQGASSSSKSGEEEINNDKSKGAS